MPQPTGTPPAGADPEATLTFSQIGFNEDLTLAIVSVERVDDAGTCYFLRRTGDTWQVEWDIPWNK